MTRHRYIRIAALALLLAACGSQQPSEEAASVDQATVTSISVDPSTTTRTIPPSARSAEVSVLSVGEAIDESGSYRVEFDPSFTLMLTEAWVGGLPVVKYAGFELIEEGFDEVVYPLVSFLRIDQLVDPRYDSPANLDDPSTLRMVDVPDDLGGFLREFPGLEVGDWFEVSVGGVAGQGFDAEVVAGNGRGGEMGEMEVLFLGTIGGMPGWFHVGEKVRFILLDVAGEQVVINYEATADEFDRFLPMAEDLMESVSFEAS